AGSVEGAGRAQERHHDVAVEEQRAASAQRIPGALHPSAAEVATQERSARLGGREGERPGVVETEGREGRRERRVGAVFVVEDGERAIEAAPRDALLVAERPRGVP